MLKAITKITFTCALCVGTNAFAAKVVTADHTSQSIISSSVNHFELTLMDDAELSGVNAGGRWSSGGQNSTVLWNKTANRPIQNAMAGKYANWKAIGGSVAKASAKWVQKYANVAGLIAGELYTIHEQNQQLNQIGIPQTVIFKDPH